MSNPSTPSFPAAGEATAALMALRDRYVPRGVFNVVPAFVDHASGAEIYDIEGRRFIDFAGGLGALNVGHCPPSVVEAICQQAQRYLHTCFHVTMNEPYVRLAQKLCESTPGDFAKKTMFVNSGAEAVENAVKIAKAYTGRRGVVVFEYGYHGRTMLTMTMTSKVRPYKYGFGTLAPDVHRIPYGYCYRCPFGLQYPSCETACGTNLENFLKTHADPEEIAALVVEPVVGEGGFIIPPPEFLPTLAAICKKYGIVFVADEVQSGFGRTGRLFAIEHSGVEPDLLISAKSLGAGLPLAAVTGRAEMMDAPMVGGLGGTYGGNPLSCAAALAVFDMIEEQGLLERGQQVGQRILERFARMAERFPLIGEVRGQGAMVAMELVSDRKTKEPARAEAAQIVKFAHERGLVLLKTGVHDNVIRVLVPLVASDALLDEGLAIIEACLEAVSAPA